MLPALTGAVCLQSWLVVLGGRGMLRQPSRLTASEALPWCPWQALDGCACSPRALGGLDPAVFSDMTECVPANVQCRLLRASSSGGLPRVGLGSQLPASGVQPVGSHGRPSAPGGGSLPSSWPCGLQSVTGCDFVSYVNHDINKNSFLRVIAQTFLGPALWLVRS